MHGSMQKVASVINQPRRGGTLRLAFLSAVVSLVVSFAAAAAPIPLYNIYRAEDGFTNFGCESARCLTPNRRRRLPPLRIAQATEPASLSSRCPGSSLDADQGQIFDANTQPARRKAAR